MKTQTVIAFSKTIFASRSRTGFYHMANGDSSARCNSRNGIAMKLADVKSFEKADVSAFCKKCFPNGKPVNFEIVDIEVR